MKYFVVAILTFISSSAIYAESERGFSFTTSGSFLPAMRAIVVVKAGEPGPGAAKHKAIASTGKYKETIKFPGDGPFDLWWQPTEGIAVKVLANVKLKNGEVKEIKIDDCVGVVAVRSDGKPRLGLIAIAAQDDPGPDEKGHVPVQTAKEYKVDMVVPAGFYAAWVTPDNGARPKKINDRFRVDAGKSITLD